MGEWPCHCAIADQDGSVELRIERFGQAVVELQRLRVLLPNGNVETGLRTNAGAQRRKTHLQAPRARRSMIMSLYIYWPGWFHRTWSEARIGPTRGCGIIVSTRICAPRGNARKGQQAHYLVVTYRRTKTGLGRLSWSKLIQRLRTYRVRSTDRREDERTDLLYSNLFVGKAGNENSKPI